MTGERRGKSVPFQQIEELINLVANTYKVKPYDVGAMLGIAKSTPNHWKHTGKGPEWAIWALKGLIAEANGDDDAKPPRIIGLAFTNDQLDTLNIALCQYERVNGDLDGSTRKLRSAVLLELAARLDRR